MKTIISRTKIDITTQSQNNSNHLPWNNEHEYGSKKSEDIGGHLFAIAADKSMQ